jgi:enamine deaminase RidA (YjgF/YER057c/UK114 family)
VRAGDTVYVSGTVAVDDEGRIAPLEDAYGQARRCLQIIADALAEAGASLTDVVRTRMFVLDPEHWVEVGRAHGDVFGETKPATTLVAVAGLVDPEALVEIEAVAVVG